MPNSRLEIAPNLNGDLIEIAGGWVTTGNQLGLGGGNKLGSVDNFGYDFIHNSITRAGISDSGNFFVSENQFFSDRQYHHVMRSVTTNDESTPKLLCSSIILFLLLFIYDIHSKSSCQFLN